MSEPSAVQRFFGGALIGVGALMMALCGGCGALFFIGFLISGLTSSNSEDLAFVIMPVILGGVPALVGFGLFAGGRALRRAPAPIVGATDFAGEAERRDDS
jgi:hypothetical protein